MAGAEVIDFNPENINKDHFGLDFLVEGWSKTSPAEALKWCAGINSGHFKNQVVRGLYRGLMEDDFEAAAALFFKQPIFQGARETRSEFASTLYRAQGFEQSLQTVLELGKERAAVNGKESAYEDTSALYGMIYNSTKGYPWKDRAEAMLKVADDPAFPQYLWQRTLAHGQWESVSDALDWASERSSNISESLANTIQDAAVNAVLSSRDAFGTQIPEWMSTNKEHPLYDRIAARFVGAVMSEDPEGAAVWAGTIKDDAMRESMQSLLKRNIPE